MVRLSAHALAVRAILVAVLMMTGIGLPGYAQAQDTVPANKTRLNRYLWATLGPGPIAGSLVVAGIDHARDEPDQWSTKFDGYGHRLGARYGQLLVEVTVEHALAAALDRPTQYQRCVCTGFGPRFGHAMVGAVTDVTSHGRAPAFPRIAGAYAGALTWVVLVPGSENGLDALASGTAAIAFSSFANLFREFIRIGR